VQGVDLPDLPGGEPGWPADVLAAGPRRVAGGGGVNGQVAAFIHTGLPKIMSRRLAVSAL